MCARGGASVLLLRRLHVEVHGLERLYFLAAEHHLADRHAHAELLIHGVVGDTRRGERELSRALRTVS